MVAWKRIEAMGLKRHTWDKKKKKALSGGFDNVEVSQREKN